MGKPGRPPLDATSPSVPVHLKLPAKDYDRFYQLAKQNRESVPDAIRRELQMAQASRR